MKISENYSLKKDRVQWILTEHYTGKDKDGNDKARERDSYHATLSQVANYLINNNETDNLSEYIAATNAIRDDMARMLEEGVK